MALAITIRFDFQDEAGHTSFTKLRVPTGPSLAQLIEFGQAAGQVWANASDAEITNISLTFTFTPPAGLKASAVALLDIAQKAAFQFTTAVSGFFAKFRVPVVQDVKFVGGSDDLDVSDPLISPFITLIENGAVVTGPATILFTDGRANPISTLAFAVEQFRKKR